MMLYTHLVQFSEVSPSFPSPLFLPYVLTHPYNYFFPRYPEGKKHLFSILTHALPGVDSNDFRKTLVCIDACVHRLCSLSFCPGYVQVCGLLISALVSVVPLVDNSASINSGNFNMTEVCTYMHTEIFIV